MYIFGCSSVSQQRTVEKKSYSFETPEEVIEVYYAALRTGDEKLLNSCFIDKKNLVVVGKMRDIQYKIRKRRVISKEEAALRNRGSTVSVLKEGDVEVFLYETIKNNREEMTFILRKKGFEWRIYSHSLGYYV
jgi:hypothetical protein